MKAQAAIWVDNLIRYREQGFKPKRTIKLALTCGEERRVMDPIEKVAHQLWPGVPVVTALEPGASDAQFLNPAGIPTYGVTGLFLDPDNSHMHGLNERIRIRSVYEGRSFLYQLVKIYAEQ